MVNPISFLINGNGNGLEHDLGKLESLVERLAEHPLPNDTANEAVRVVESALKKTNTRLNTHATLLRMILLSFSATLLYNSEMALPYLTAFLGG